MKISSENKVEMLTNIVNFVFNIQKHLTPIIEINNKYHKPTIYAMWHGHQCCIFGLKNKSNVNILISRSVDGEIIASAAQNLGFKTVRGSKGKKGSVEATLQMIERLKIGEDVAIMVDGPSGPNRKVKDGVIRIAQKTGAPIVPVIWYSPDISFLKLPTWDKFTYPFGYTRLINLYGEPIYVDADADEETIKNKKLELEKSLLALEENPKKAWKDAWGYKLWTKKR